MILYIILFISIFKNILGLNIQNGIAKELIQQRNNARESRIQELQQLEKVRGELSKPDSNELKGLLSKGDTYNPTSFSEKHHEFKRHHNEIFHYLTISNNNNNNNNNNINTNINNNHKNNPKLFYLDGANGGTTSCLLKLNHPPTSLFTANKYIDSYEGIKEVAGYYSGLYSDSDENNKINILLKSAEWALSNSYYDSNDSNDSKQNKQELIGWGEVGFDGYYFDGCGGGSKMIIDLIKRGPLSPRRNNNDNDVINDQKIKNKRVVIGFTLTNAYHDGSSILDREQLVITAIHRLINTQQQHQQQHEQLNNDLDKNLCYMYYNYVYRVADRPQSFGLPDIPQYQTLQRFCDGTLTTWLVLSSNPIQ